MEEQFEQQLTGLMDYRSEAAAPFTPGDVVAAARRRSRSRSLGVAGSALAVVAVGVGAVALAGGNSGGGAVSAAAGDSTSAVGATVTSAAPATSADAPATSAVALSTSAAGAPTAAGRTVSPVVRTASGEKIKVADGVQMYVTKTEKCAVYSGPFAGNAPQAGQPDCKDVVGPNMRWDGKGDYLAIQGLGDAQAGTILTGVFQGAKAPSLIEVVQDGKHYPATIVTTAGMENWVGYYVTFPLSTKTVDPTKPFSYTVYAYDAAGHQLTQSPPAAKGGS